jgi:glutamate-1-semialdehyde 2,1-aminomutase
MMEAMNTTEPNSGFLEGVRDLAHEHGALFIMDEIITGFRYHIGGAQTLFGVTPDLATFGKSMGNGFPISAVLGKAEYMNQMEEVFFSSTFGGEAVSLAASIATIKKMQNEPVHETLNRSGEIIIHTTRELIAKHKLSDCISISGHPSWSLMQFRDTAIATSWEIKSLFVQEILLRGILTAGSYNISYAHNQGDLVQLAKAQDETFGIVREALDAGNVRSYLVGAPAEPVFKVR